MPAADRITPAWLPNPLISASLGGFRETPQINGMSRVFSSRRPGLPK